MEWIKKPIIGITAILAVMLVSMNGRSPTRSFLLGATTLAEEGADEGRGV